MKPFPKDEEALTGAGSGSKAPADHKRPNERPSDEDYNKLTEFIKDGKNKKIYKRQNLLGKGGFARVFQVVEVTGTNKMGSLADKIISKSMLRRCSKNKSKVEKEIEIHSMLSHVNLVQVIKSFEDEHFIHIILENCSMGTLNDVLKARGTIDELEARYYVNQIMQGVQYIHQEGYLHCDLKLSNILLSKDMVIKIGDFGLVCSIEESQPGQMKGTPNYIAPEVLAEQGHGVKSDIWSIGCMFFALLCGKPPFQTSSLVETYNKIRNGDYLVPHSASEDAKSLIDLMLALKVEDRGHLELDEAYSHQYLLAHPFFSKSFLPKKLPTCAATTDQWKLDWFDILTPGVPEIPDYRKPEESSQEVSMTAALDEATRCMPIIEDGGTLGSLGLPEEDVPRKTPHQQQKTKTFLFRVVENLDRCSNSSNIEPDSLDVFPVFIKKWVDYTNKLGFGVQLTDNTVLILFKDMSRLAALGDMIEMVPRMVDLENKVEYFKRQQLTPEENNHIKIQSLDWITDYINNQVPDCTTDLDLNLDTIVPTANQYRMSQIKRWKRSESGVVVELSNHIVQVDLEQECIKVVLWEINETREMFLTVIRDDSTLHTYSFTTLIQIGSPEHLLPVIGLTIQGLVPLLRRRNRQPQLGRAE